MRIVSDRGAEPAATWWGQVTGSLEATALKTFVRNNYLNPLVLIPVVVVLALIVGGLFVFGGGGSGAKRVGTAKRVAPSAADLPLGEGRRIKPPPIGSSGLLDVARRRGRLVVAQARARIRSPGRVRLSVSSSPKQRVTVNWQLGCYRNRRAIVGRGAYRTRTPDVRRIRVPMSGAEHCIATAGAQLTRDGVGRVQVAVVAG
jgi:hypothetical protein